MPEEYELVDYQVGMNGLPKENVLRFVFSDGSWMAVRPSGTEPKLKLYFSIRGANLTAAEERLDKIRNSAIAYLGL
jgi:phosphoglucomutase